MRQLTETEQDAFEQAMQVTGPGSPLMAVRGRLGPNPTPDDARTAHDEMLIEQCVASIKAQTVDSMRAAGEQLAQLPAEQREKLLLIPGLDAEKRARIIAIVNE